MLHPHFLLHRPKIFLQHSVAALFESYHNVRTLSRIAAQGAKAKGKKGKGKKGKGKKVRRDMALRTFCYFVSLCILRSVPITF